MKTKLFIFLLMSAICSSCSIVRKASKSENIAEIVTESKIENISVSDSLSMQASRIDKLTTELSLTKSEIEVLTKNIRTLENQNINEKGYYESGALQYERETVNTKESNTNIEITKNLELQVSVLEIRLDSITVEFNALKTSFSELQENYDSLYNKDLQSNTDIKAQDTIWKIIAFASLFLILVLAVYVFIRTKIK